MKKIVVFTIVVLFNINSWAIDMLNTCDLTKEELEDVLSRPVLVADHSNLWKLFSTEVSTSISEDAFIGHFNKMIKELTVDDFSAHGKEVTFKVVDRKTMNEMHTSGELKKYAILQMGYYTLSGAVSAKEVNNTEIREGFYKVISLQPGEHFGKRKKMIFQPIFHQVDNFTFESVKLTFSVFQEYLSFAVKTNKVHFAQYLEDQLDDNCSKREKLTTYINEAYVAKKTTLTTIKNVYKSDVAIVPEVEFYKKWNNSKDEGLFAFEIDATWFESTVYKGIMPGRILVSNKSHEFYGYSDYYRGEPLNSGYNDRHFKTIQSCF